MNNSELQKFVKAVFDLATERCGPEFTDKLNVIRLEREMILNDAWKDTFSAEESANAAGILFREIDFDTIIVQAGKYLDDKDYVILLLDIATSARQFGRFGKIESTTKLIIDNYSHSASQSILSAVHQLRGDTLFYRSDFNGARSEYEKSLEIFKTLKDQIGVASMLNSLGVLKIESGQPITEAEKDINEAKNIARSHGNNLLLSQTLLNLANIYSIEGSWEKALTHYDELSKIIDPEKQKGTLARANYGIAIVYKFQKEYDKASEYLQKCITMSNEIHNSQLKALSYLEKAEVLYYRGEYATSTALATTAFQIFSEIGDRLSLADVYKVMGMINRDAERFELALSYFENSLKINQNFNYPLSLGETHYEIGQYFTQTGKKENALDNFHSALKSFKQINASWKIAEVEKAIDAISA